jgi:drug/metabolite transporter (DMT)-like permease
VEAGTWLPVDVSGYPLRLGIAGADVNGGGKARDAGRPGAPPGHPGLPYRPPARSYNRTVTPTTLKRSAYLPVAGLTLLALIWGYNWVVMKVGIKYSDPFTFAALRNLLGGLVLLALVAVRRGPLLPKPFWPTAVFGIFQTSLSGLGMYALYLGSAGKTSVLNYTMPFWLLLIAWPVLGERIRGVQWAAVALALVGLIFVLEPWQLRGLAAGILAVSAGLSWAVASVLFKIVRKRYQVEIMSFTAWQALLGSIPLIVVALFTATGGPAWNGSFISALAYNVIVATPFALLIWWYVLQALSAGMAGLSSLAIPVVGVLAAWIQLGERPGALEAVGMALILAALAVVTARGLITSRRAVGEVAGAGDDKAAASGAAGSKVEG